jgi:hypothetical protein
MPTPRSYLAASRLGTLQRILAVGGMNPSVLGKNEAYTP